MKSAYPGFALELKFSQVWSQTHFVIIIISLHKDGNLIPFT